MEIELIAVGKTVSKTVADLTDQYASRIPHYLPFKITYIPDLKNKKNLSEEKQKTMEGEAVLQKITPQDFLILLDERGREFTSMEFSSFLQKQMASGKKRIIFIIGGPYGFSPDVYARADYKISLSKMTFNHEMVRAFAVEQIYRGLTILRGEPYHHE